MKEMQLDSNTGYYMSLDHFTIKYYFIEIYHILKLKIIFFSKYKQ